MTTNEHTLTLRLRVPKISRKAWKWISLAAVVLAVAVGLIVHAATKSDPYAGVPSTVRDNIAVCNVPIDKSDGYGMWPDENDPSGMVYSFLRADGTGSVLIYFRANESGWVDGHVYKTVCQ